jgi:adenylate kinase family enzyme
MHIAIIGNSGSGKSTLARRLSTSYNAVALDLDTIAWEPDLVGVARDPTAAHDDLNKFCATNSRWVIEGCYASLIGERLKHKPLLIFMEPGVEACIANCQRRPWEPHKYKSKQEQDEKLAFLLSWVRDYYHRDGDLSFNAHQHLFDKYDGPKRRLSTQDQQGIPAELEPYISA